MGVFSTFAWYQASNVANITPVSKDGTLTTVLSSTNLGDFEVKVTTASLDKDVVMTDTSGNTYAVDESNNLLDAGVPAGKAKIATVTLKVTVTYKGSATSDDTAIGAMWAATLNSDITISTAASGTYASRVKFTSAADNYTHNAANATVTVAAKATAAAWTFTSKTTGEKAAPNMYVGFDGGSKTAGAAQNDGDSALAGITITFTPAATAA